MGRKGLGGQGAEDEKPKGSESNEIDERNRMKLGADLITAPHQPSCFRCSGYCECIYIWFLRKKWGLMVSFIFNKATLFHTTVSHLSKAPQKMYPSLPLPSPLYFPFSFSIVTRPESFSSIICLHASF